MVCGYWHRCVVLIHLDKNQYCRIKKFFKMEVSPITHSGYDKLLCQRVSIHSFFSNTSYFSLIGLIIFICEVVQRFKTWCVFRGMFGEQISNFQIKLRTEQINKLHVCQWSANINWIKIVKNYRLYLGSWRHLLVKIFRLRCIVKTFRDQSYIYMEAIYQISAQSETWINTVSEGEVLAPFT